MLIEIKKKILQQAILTKYQAYVFSHERLKSRSSLTVLS